LAPTAARQVPTPVVACRTGLQKQNDVAARLCCVARHRTLSASLAAPPRRGQSSALRAASSPEGDPNAAGDEEGASGDEAASDASSASKSDEEALTSGAGALAGADDVAPALEVDWREFRAKLISQEVGAPGAAADDAAADAASAANLDLLKAQNPRLAAVGRVVHTT
jgi:putative transcriptional regulator